MRPKISFFVILLVLFVVGFGSFHFNKKGEVASLNTKEDKVKGIILPHHDLAKELFVASLEKLRETNNPSIFVILGTNHYYPDGSTLTTALDVYDYPIEKEI